MKHTLRFPEKFLWGAASASFQVEGGIENCDWAEAARQGKVPACGAACDQYNRYEEDFNTAQKLGHNSHRISVEWARIEPEEGKFDLKEAQHYRNVINALRVRGLEPFITLWHFTLPLWFSNDGGFENRRSIERFKNYAEFVTREILGDVSFVVLINEPSGYAHNGYIRKYWPPFKKNVFTYISVCNNLIKAHNAASVAIKKIRPDIKVGVAKDNVLFESVGPNPINFFAAKFLYHWINHRFLNKTREHLDFIGLNYYFYMLLGRTLDLPKTDMGWSIYPEGIYHVLRELIGYGKPVYIMENGLADATDTQRGKFIVDHLAQIHRAIQEGVDVRGYLHWSIMDNYEWTFGFEKRFGLIEVNFVTQQRKIRHSAYVYKNICETNTLEIES